jgi:hypothetical protein
VSGKWTHGQHLWQETLSAIDRNVHQDKPPQVTKVMQPHSAEMSLPELQNEHGSPEVSRRASQAMVGHSLLPLVVQLFGAISSLFEQFLLSGSPVDINAVWRQSWEGGNVRTDTQDGLISGSRPMS